MKVLPLSSPKVMLSLRYKRYYGQLRLPCRPSEISFPYIHQLPPERHRQGSPVFIVEWLPLRATPVTPEAHLSVLVVIVRIDAPVFPTVGKGRQLHRVLEATSGFARAAARRFARLSYRAFVRKLSASGYPLHLPQATWAKLPNSHRWTLTDKSHVLHGIPYKSTTTNYE
jgi:hypothetical protein